MMLTHEEALKRARDIATCACGENYCVRMRENIAAALERVRDETAEAVADRHYVLGYEQAHREWSSCVLETSGCVGGRGGTISDSSITAREDALKSVRAGRKAPLSDDMLRRGYR